MRVGGAGSGADLILGGLGRDRISGNQGNDRLRGGSSGDRLIGGFGNDGISARDGQRDRISCGSGHDRVIADRVDRLARDCERVSRRSVRGSSTLKGPALGAGGRQGR